NSEQRLKGCNLMLSLGSETSPCGPLPETQESGTGVAPYCEANTDQSVSLLTILGKYARTGSGDLLPYMICDASDESRTFQPLLSPSSISLSDLALIQQSKSYESLFRFLTGGQLDLQSISKHAIK